MSRTIKKSKLQLALHKYHDRRDFAGKGWIYSNVKKPNQMGNDSEQVASGYPENKFIKRFYSKKRRANFKALDKNGIQI